MNADNIVLYKPVVCEDYLVEMQSDVTSIVDWVDMCGLYLNLKEDEVPGHVRKHHPTSSSFTVFNTSIEQVPSFNSLGVLLK